jgi:hypothetical protein
VVKKVAPGKQLNMIESKGLLFQVLKLKTAALLLIIFSPL